ncbi:MAG: molybdenum transporter substrate-binding protein [Hyphomicrobiales bacterium]|jgi:molybdate transport system substrate-binding protein|nr:molybdenum transporter substrate-binding protein [Hyphomicrobiales bacterium]
MSRHLTRRSALVLAAALSLGAPAARAQGRPLTIFAAASLKEALDEAAAAFAASGAARPVLSYAGSNQLARQIEQGAPADLFLAADEEWMDHLAKGGLIRAETRRALLGNALVLVGPAGTPRVEIGRDTNLAGLLKGGRLAVPDMAAVPAGRYAKAALESLGLFEQVKTRIAGTENVRVALALVARGEAPFGIVYATDAAAEPQVGVAGTFPAGSHPPIIYPAAITASSTHPDAGAFLEFLRGDTAARIFLARGFTVLR